MKNLFYFLLSFLLMSCSGNKKNSFDESNVYLSKEAEEIHNISQDLSEIIHLNLIRELKAFIVAIEDSSNRYNDLEIIEVLFRHKKDGCYVTIAPNPYYLSEPLYGYLILDGKMISFYFEDDQCGTRLIEKDKLLKDVPDIYPSEKCQEAVQSGYDPHGKTFKINDETLELELVYSGMF